MVVKGKRVDVLQRSSDAEFILEDDELALKWREQRVSPSWFRGPNGERTTKVLSTMDTPDDHHRFDQIRAWVAKDFAGDTDAAITSRPLLALESGYLLDGWHRLVVWLDDKKNQQRSGPTTLIGYRK